MVLLVATDYCLARPLDDVLRSRDTEFGNDLAGCPAECGPGGVSWRGRYLTTTFLDLPGYLVREFRSRRIGVDDALGQRQRLEQELAAQPLP